MHRLHQTRVIDDRRRGLHHSFLKTEPRQESGQEIESKHSVASIFRSKLHLQNRGKHEQVDQEQQEGLEDCPRHAEG
jgi:hypothetical protein